MPREGTAGQPLCADIGGLSLHAAVRIEAHGQIEVGWLAPYAASAGRVRRAAGGTGMNLQHQRTAAMCEQLKTARLAAEWPALAQQAARDEASFADGERLARCGSCAGKSIHGASVDLAW